MNRLTLAFFLRLAVMSCVLLSCLIALQTPALAIAIYDAFTEISLSFGQVPSGTSISFLPGVTFIRPPIQIGNAIATSFASTSPSGTALASALGSASGPPNSSAASFASALSVTVLLNQNATFVNLPLTISHTRFPQIASSDRREQTGSDNFFQATIDSILLSFFNGGSAAGGGGSVTFTDSGSDSFLFPLSPGLHSLVLTAQAGGDASSPIPSPTPEPVSLILFGTTMAGLGLAARWRRRRQN
jgi:hypothetical protein